MHARTFHGMFCHSTNVGSSHHTASAQSFPLRIQNISFQLACVANHLIPEIAATFVLFAAVISYADMKSSEVMILAVMNTVI